MFDLILRNADIVDGTGSPAKRGSVAVVDGKIAAIDFGAALETAQAPKVIDASGLTLAPGFIDLHSHADFSIQGAPAAETQLTQGVTTLLTGNCGASPFPVRDVAAMEAANAQFEASYAGTWSSAGGFAAVTQRSRPGVNILTQVGLSSLRDYVVGAEDRPATSTELTRMQDEIRKAAAEGARGFSTGLIYAPGSYASEAEVTALVSVAVEAGLLYSTHMRNESFELLAAVREALDAAESVGARLEISHLKAMGPANHGLPRRALAMIDEARERGVDVTADVYPYTASSTKLSSRLPGYALDGGVAALLERLADSAERTQIARDIAARFGRDIDPDGVRIASLGPAPGADYSWATGRSLAEIGEAQGCSPEEAVLRVLEAHEGVVAIVNHAMAEADVEEVLTHPFVAVASDGWTMTSTGTGVPHPRSFGTFTRVLGRYVRERSVLPLEEAVRKMTSLPASRVGLSDRGTLERGKVADLVLFNADTVSDRATYDNPWNLSTGIEYLFLAGNEAVSGGHVASDRHGRVL